MLTSSSKLLRRAQKEGYAVGAFNTYNLEITRAILRAAEARRAPVIVQLGSGALKYAGTEALGALVLAEAHQAKIPVAVQLDHSTEIDEITACIKLGFSAVMIDGSALSLDGNIALTRRAVRIARAKRVSVEAELGSIVGEEDCAGAHAAHAAMTDPAQAAEFVHATRVDALAVAIGNVHGFYRGKPKLDMARLRKIRKHVSVPLVLHGASGLSADAIQRSISLGVCKFNVNTEIRVAFIEALAETLPKARRTYDLPALFAPVIEGMQRVVEEKIAMFGSEGKAV